MRRLDNLKAANSEPPRLSGSRLGIEVVWPLAFYYTNRDLSSKMWQVPAALQPRDFHPGIMPLLNWEGTRFRALRREDFAQIHHHDFGIVAILDEYCRSAAVNERWNQTEPMLSN